MGRGSPLLLVLVLILLAGAGWMVLGGGTSAPTPSPGGSADAGAGGQPTRTEDAELQDRSGDLQLPGRGGSDAIRPADQPANQPGSAPRVQATPAAATANASWLWPQLAQHEFAVRGTVLVTGQPLEGALVRLVGSSDGVASQTTTDAEGRFQLKSRAGVGYLLHIEEPGLFPYVRGIPGSWPRQELDLGILRPAPAVPLSVVVTGVDELPLEDAWVRVGDQVTHHEIPAARLEDGTFQTIAPPLGFLVAGAPYYRTTRTHLRRATDGRAHIRLEPGLRATITVWDLQNEPIPGVQVFLIDDDDSSELRQRQDFGQIGSLSTEFLAKVADLRGHTNDEGEVQFAELEDTGYIVFVRHESYLPMARQYIEPNPNLEVLTAELGMRPAPRLRVLVRDSDGKVPSGLRIGALEPAKRLWVDGRPNSDGEVDAVLPEDGDWMVEAWAPGHHLISQTLVPVSPTDLTEITPFQTLTLAASSGPGIVFLDPSGTRLRDVTLTIEVASKARLEAAPPNGPEWGQVLSGIALDEAKLDKPFAHERPRYLASERGFGGAVFGFEDWPRTKAMNLEGEPWAVVLEPAGDVVVTVVDDTRIPVAGARVYLTTDGLGKPGAPVTDEAGQVRFEDLPAAELSFKARGPSGRISDRVELDFEPEPGSAPTEIRLKLPR